MSLSQGNVDMVASDGADTATYLWATSWGAPLPVPAAEDMVAAGGGSIAAYLQATS